jgi:hypothetical protein
MEMPETAKLALLRNRFESLFFSPSHSCCTSERFLLQERSERHTREPESAAAETDPDKFMETLDSVIARLRPSFSILAEQITAFASQLETGSNRLELREGAARVVASEL